MTRAEGARGEKNRPIIGDPAHFLQGYRPDRGGKGGRSGRRMVRAGFGVAHCLAFERVEKVDRTAQVGDDDGATDHETDAEHFEEFIAVDPRFLALGHVVADAVVAAQDHRGDQAEHLLGLHVQGARAISLGVQGKEAADDLVVLTEDAFVHPLAERGELFDAVIAHQCAASRISARRLLRSAAARSSKPPTCVPLMKICGTVRRPPLFWSMRSRWAGSMSMRTSFQPSPLALSRFLAATQ